MTTFSDNFNRAIGVSWEDIAKGTKMSQLDDTYFLHKIFKLPVSDEPVTEFNPDTVQFCKNLMREKFEDFIEVFELKDDAIKTATLAGVLADLLYATNGTAVAFGIQLDDVFDAVHAANLTRQAGSTYRPANLSQVIWPMPHKAW